MITDEITIHQRPNEQYLNCIASYKKSKSDKCKIIEKRKLIYVRNNNHVRYTV